MPTEMKILYFIIYIIESLILLQYTSTLFKAKHKKYIELPFLLFLYMIAYFFSFHSNFLLNAMTFFLANFFFIFAMYFTSMQSALFHAAMSTALMCASELIVISIISYYTGNFFKSKNYLFTLMSHTVFSKFIYFLILYFISHLISNKKEKVSTYNKSTFLLSLLPLVTSFILLTLIYVNAETTLSPSLDLALCISSILILCLNIFIFSFHHYIQKENTKHMELELLLQKEHDSTKYYQMLLQQTENQKILIHDMKKHLQSIAILNENKDFNKIETYVNHLIHSSSLQNNYNFCENKLLNSILSQYKKQCMDKNIAFFTDIRHNTINFMLFKDLTSLFCNLLDNAVEAAEKTSDAFIELNVSQKENTPYTIITMINSCRQNPFKNNTFQLVTSKKDKQRHGYGIKSIQKTIENYHGNMKMYYDDDSLTFHTIITLNAK